MYSYEFSPKAIPAVLQDSLSNKISAQIKKHVKQCKNVLEQLCHLLQFYDTGIYSHNIGFPANIFTNISSGWGEVTPEIWKGNYFQNTTYKKKVCIQHIYMITVILLEKIIAVKRSSEFIGFPLKTKY